MSYTIRFASVVPWNNLLIGVDTFGGVWYLANVHEGWTQVEQPEMEDE